MGRGARIEVIIAYRCDKTELRAAQSYHCSRMI
jgi:hypothetical protein